MTEVSDLQTKKTSSTIIPNRKKKKIKQKVTKTAKYPKRPPNFHIFPHRLKQQHKQIIAKNKIPSPIMHVKYSILISYFIHICFLSISHFYLSKHIILQLIIDYFLFCTSSSSLFYLQYLLFLVPYSLPFILAFFVVFFLGYKQNQYWIFMSRVIGLYSPVNPDRVNPEFIGIGQKFSEHKRNRLDSDKYRKNIQSNFAFTLKLNQQLQRSLESKQKQLHRLQAARERHHNDINFKLSEQQRKQKELEQLRIKSKQQRVSIKNGIKHVQQSLKSDRLNNKINIKQDLHEKNMLFKAQYQAFKNQKYMKHKSVEISKKIGNQRINQYYRHKNLQSYNNYLKRIDEEDQKSDENMQSIKKMNSQMKRLQKKIQKKQHKLKEVLDQINMYAVQCQNQRKANFLATVSAFRPSSTTTSWRSKPTDVLRTSLNKSKIQETI